MSGSAVVVAAGTVAGAGIVAVALGVAGVAAGPTPWVYLVGLAAVAVAAVVLAALLTLRRSPTIAVSALACVLAGTAVVLPLRAAGDVVVGEGGDGRSVSVIGEAGGALWLRAGGVYAVAEGRMPTRVVPDDVALLERVSISADLVVVGGGTGAGVDDGLVAFDHYGRELWRLEPRGEDHTREVVAADESTLVVVDCEAECRLVGLDDAGGEAWSRDTGDDFWIPTRDFTRNDGSLLLADEIWVGDQSGESVTSWAMDGTGRRDVEGAVAFPAAGETTVLRFGGEECRLRGVADGEERWRTTAPDAACDGWGSSRSSASLLYLGDDALAVDRETGEVSTASPPEDTGAPWSASGGSDQAWINDDRSRVLVRSPMTGRELWSAQGAEGAVGVTVAPGGTAVRTRGTTLNPFVERSGRTDGLSTRGAATLLVAAAGESDPRECTVPSGRELLGVLPDRSVLALGRDSGWQVLRCD